MSYQSPIEIITSELQSKVEEEVYSAVQRVGVVVHKDDLLRALSYDRKQYENGYRDRDKEIVRCKDCIHYRYYGLAEETVSECKIGHCENQHKDWFCADGERRETK